MLAAPIRLSPEPQGERMSKRYQISKIARDILSLWRRCSAWRRHRPRPRLLRLRPSRALNLLLRRQLRRKAGCSIAAQRPSRDPRTAAKRTSRPTEAKQLFGLVDQLLKFSSQETGLPIKSDVKRQTDDARRCGEIPDRKVQRRRGRQAHAAQRDCPEEIRTARS